MEFQQLICFREVAATKSYSQAAANLGLGRGGVRLNIKELEKQLSCTLFDSDEFSTGANLTAAGNVLLSYAERIIALEKNAKEALNANTAVQKHPIRIAHNDNLVHTVVPKVCRAYLATEQNADQQFIFSTIHHTEKMISMLMSGEADIGFSQADSHVGVNSIQIATDQLYVLLPIDHPLARKRKIRLSELAHEPLILANSSFLSHPFGSKESLLTDVISRMFAAEHITPIISGISAAFPARLSYVQSGMGYTITSGTPQDETRIAAIEIDNPYSKRPVYMLWPQNRTLPPNVFNFKEFCIDYFKDIYTYAVR